MFDVPTARSFLTDEESEDEREIRPLPPTNYIAVGLPTPMIGAVCCPLPILLKWSVFSPEGDGGANGTDGVFTDVDLRIILRTLGGDWLRWVLYWG
jgi:hypothetical protein